MRPHDKPKGNRAAEAAVRTQLRACLGWLRGFPNGGTTAHEVPWFAMPRLDSHATPEAFQVTRETLRHTEFGRNAARRRFPTALSRVVGDVGEWAARIDTQLQFLKTVVHDGTPLPDLNALLKSGGFRRKTRDGVTRLVRAEPALEPALTALVWLYWNDEGALGTALQLMRQYTVELLRLRRRLGDPEWLPVALQSLELLADGGDPVLLHLLADDRCWEVPTTIDGYPGRLKRAMTEWLSVHARDGAPARFRIDRPKPGLGEDLVKFLWTLADTPRRSRHRRVVLLARLVTDEMLGDWAGWWAKAEAIERAVQRLGQRQRSGPPLKRERRAMEKRIDSELAHRQPFSWNARQELIGRVADSASPRTFAALVGCLDHIVDARGGLTKIETLLGEWGSALATSPRGKGVVTRLVEAQRSLFAQFDGAEAQRHVATIAGFTEEMIYTWIDSRRPQRLIKPTMKAVSRLVAAEPKWDLWKWSLAWDALVDVIELTGDPGLAAAAVASRPPARMGLQGKAWTTLLRLSGPDVERFGMLAAAWKPEHWSEALIKELSLLTKEPETAALVIAAFESGDQRRLTRIIGRSCLARSLGLEPYPSVEIDVAATLDPTPYPHELHGLLEELARHDPNAERATDQILGKDYPRPEHLRAELAAIARKLETAAPGEKRALSARARSLEKRLDAPVSISARRLENYRAKLERRVQHARLGQWEETLVAQARIALRRTLGFAPPDEWLERDDLTRLLTSFAELEPGFRKLAMRLLKARCGPEPWDLREAQQNRAFLRRLQRRKLNYAQWLNDPEPTGVTVGAIPLQLALERDPLEVMRMGEPFQTCLAPGSFNFFAAVANAADINKRVLYARDDTGKVQGRCLLALTDDGHILTFNVYAHRHVDVMEQAVADFVQKLATAMGTSVVPHGKVSNLVAPDWYDDGPTDITGRLGFLQPESAFVRALPSMQPNDIVSALQTVLSPDPITPSIVAALVDNPALQARPEFVLPLLPYLTPETLDPWTRIRIVAMLRQSGAVRAARDLATPLFREALSRTDTNLAVQLAEELLALDLPSLALRLIRATRPKDVRSWRDEWPGRTLIAAKAMEQLARPKQAQELYRLAGRS